MKKTFRKAANLLISLVVSITMLFSGVQPSTVSAQAQAQNNLRRDRNAETGKVTLISGADNQPISVLGPSAVNMTPEAQSLALVQHFASEFGLTDPAKELRLSEIDQPSAERVVSKYQQIYRGVPVMAGELMVNASKAGELLSMNGEVSQGLSLDTKPELTVEIAIETAKQGMVKWYGGEAKDYTSTESSLWIFDETLLRPSIRPTNLVWRIEMVFAKAGAPIRELVLVDAKTGNVTLHFNQADTAWVANTTSEISLTKINSSSLKAEVPAVADSTWYVTPTGNDANSCVTPDLPCLTINAAIGKATAGDNINVAIGTYTGVGYVVFSLKSVNIYGGWNTGFTTQSGMSNIQGSNLWRCIDIRGTGTVVSIDHLNLQYCSSDYGAGIHVFSSSLTIDNSIISNNNGNSSAGVYNEGGTVTINNSVISNNHGNTGDGAVYNASGTLTINNSVISDNTSSFGSGITNYGNLTINNSIVANNVSIADGGGGIYNDYGNLATINNSQITNNRSPNKGGGIYNNGTVVMNTSVVSGNSSILTQTASGGGIFNAGTITIIDSTISNNVASYDGGGINSSGTLMLDRSVVNGNQANEGGGIAINSAYSNPDNISNTTINNNLARYGGGLHVKTGNVNINNSTISQNASIDPIYVSYGGGLQVNTINTVNLKNSILSGNIADTQSDCSGQILSGGHNLISVGMGCVFTPANGDLIGTQGYPIYARLGNLLDNGGPTLTQALLVGSPAINAGDPATCAITDQRGVARPQGAACDIGAFEGSISQSVIPLVKTYTANGSNGIPGTFLCDQTDPTCAAGDSSHAQPAHKYALGIYAFYLDRHNRTGIDQNNMPIISTVHYCSTTACPYANAFWSGSQMVYGDAYGFPLADDVVAHELTHGVTQYESNLFYFYQSGAINESFSDVWGEYYDQTNGLGNDAPAVKWLMGEDVTGSTPFRSMSNPPVYGDPDKMSSANYYESYLDNGGVHTNSGVNNKAVFLMVDGGAFNSKTVSALGWDKTAAIYYEAQTNLLSSGADYSDLYYAIQQACVNLTEQLGITASDCQQVKNALDAVEMNGQPAAGFNPDAPVCAAGYYPLPYFKDDMESGTGKWTTTGNWFLDAGYASSPTHMLYGDDSFASSDSSATMATGVALPVVSNILLHFKHAFAFEYYQNEYYDGAVLEYTLNNGASWVDASPLFVEGQNYKGTIMNYSGTTNALKGRSGFVGDSHGYVSSRYNLTSFGGQTVRFRWRFATDNMYSYLGWMVDDIQIYTCEIIPPAPTVTASVRASVNPTNLASVDFTVAFSQSVTGVDLSDFSLITSGVSGAAVSGLSGSGSVYTVTVNTGSGDGSLRLDVVDDNSIVNGTSKQLGGAAVGDGNFTTGQVYTVNKSSVFADVPLTYWANNSIERLYNSSVTGGCMTVPLSYCPATPVTRAQMAIFLLRGMHGSTYTPPAATGTKFNDVPLGTFGVAWIEQLATEGITSGCGGGNYCPTTPVSRAQMAIFLVRAKHGITFTPPTATGLFTDVAIGSFGADYIEQLSADAITSGCGSGNFCPNTTVKRDSMAVFLVKTFGLP